MKSTNGITKLSVGLITMIIVSSCAKSGDSFSLLADSKTFKQSTAITAKPVDILWVVDNSGSMANSQSNLASNFSAFISRFQSLHYDFHMAVTTTDAYLADLNYHNPIYSKFRDGSATHSGVFIMDQNTPNLSNVFVTNILEGTGGYGDERAFSSFQQTLSNSLNVGFRRPNAYLAIIMISDEDDFSHNNMTLIESYTNPIMTPISDFVTYLDTLTGSTAATRKNNYSVSTISILDSTCLNQLANSTQKIGQRYMQMADATNGTKGSLCSNFGQTLDVISASVLSLSSTFILDRTPVVSSIVVTVNGSIAAQDASNGWTYDSSNNSVTFHGTGIPPADATVLINFDPTTVIF